MKIQRIFIYPVKSLRPVEVEATEITNEGLRFDRQYILVKAPESTARQDVLVQQVTIKNTYELGLFHTAIDKSWSRLTITHAKGGNDAALTLPLTPSPLTLLNAASYTVSIFGTRATGLNMGDVASQYFSNHLKKQVLLLYIGGDGHREIPGRQFVPNHVGPLPFQVNEKLQPQRVRFADAAPLLITTTASEEDARARLPPSTQGEDVIVRFRPNVHIDVSNELKAYDEDHWSMLSIQSQHDPAQEVSVRCMSRAVRCLSLNVDLMKGSMIIAPRQLYGLLAKDRRVNEAFPNKPVFGQYACAGPSGAILRVGDIVTVTELNSRSSTPSTQQVVAAQEQRIEAT